MTTSDPVKAEQRSVTAIGALYAVLAAALVLPLLVFAWAGWRSYHAHFAEAGARLARTAEIVKEHAARVFQTHELILGQVNQLIEGMSDEDIRANEPLLHARLKFLADTHDQVSTIFIFDTKGRALVTSTFSPTPPRVNVSDRDYFRVPRDSALPATRSYVSELFSGRVTGDVVFVVSRRRGILPGAQPFTGVTALSINPAFFRDYFERVAAAGFTTVVLARQDGAFLARYPQLVEDVPRLPASGAMLKAIAHAPERGIFESYSPVDSVWRVIAYRRLPDYPVYVTVGLDRSAVIGEWRASLLAHLMFAGPAAAALFGLTLFAYWITRKEGLMLRQLQTEIARREIAEHQLRQAQKMEAIGQLTGGIAHDFNNLLMIVSGSADRMRREVASEKSLQLLDMIKAAAQRGENLTRQLLAYSQLRAVNPRVIDICRTVHDTIEMLRRSLRGDIEIKIDVPDAVCAVEVDPSEFELAMLNIAVNARDAMPSGGVFSIAVTPVRLAGEARLDGLRGEFFAVSCNDTGSGIRTEHLPRVFEPYFTTKETGKGTGLGLSQVYGFAKQAGGTARVSSSVGTGTTVTIYLPASAKVPQRELTERPLAAGAEHGRSGTALLVEDNPEVAEVMAGLLSDLGYSVLRAATAPAALDVLRQTEVNVVVSDIVMPGGMNGIDLARAIQKQYPGMPVVLASGYSNSARAAHAEGFRVLSKPFDAAALAAALRAG